MSSRNRLVSIQCASSKRKTPRPTLTGHFEHEATQVGRNVDYLAKARQAREDFTQHQFDRLCSRVERNRAKFGYSHLMRILGG